MAAVSLAVILVFAWTPVRGEIVLQRQKSPTTASLRGLHAVDSQVAWSSGTDSTVLRTEDGGRHWRQVNDPDPGAIDFRDIHAINARTAVVMGTGSPALIYRTTDSGVTWQVAYRNDHASIFLDAMAFWDDRRGLAFSDPIDGRLWIIETDDGGATWKPLPQTSLPETRVGEAGFAASGTCLAVIPGGHAWIGLGGAVSEPATARILSTSNFGARWKAANTPLPISESSGIFSLIMVDEQRGVVVGGDYLKPGETAGTCAVTQDGGRTWRLPTGKPPRGYRSAVGVLGPEGQPILVAVGTNGVDVSYDLGDNWQPLADDSLHAVSFAPKSRTGWASGPNGTIVRFDHP